MYYYVDGMKMHPKEWMFPSGEVGVACLSFPVKRVDCIKVVAAITNSDDFMRLAMLADALQRHYIIEREFVLTLGYMPYGRQDRVCNEGESLSVKVAAQLLDTMGFDRIELIDTHSPVTQASFKTKIVEKKIEDIFSSLFTKERSTRVLVAPDEGAAKRLKNLHGFKRTVFASKTRDLATGKITSLVINGDVEGENVVVVDDLVDGGATFVTLADALSQAGCMKKDLVVTHGIFTKGHEVVADKYDNVYTSNTYHIDRVGLIDGVNYARLI